MSLLDRLADLTQSILTTDLQLRQLRDSLVEIRQEQLRSSNEMLNLRKRVARLEAARDAERAQLAADRARMEAEMATYKAEFERMLLQLNRVMASLSRQFPTVNEPASDQRLLAGKMPDTEDPEG